ncbi:unnamed protein product [Cuscuta epithymum]|uniref:Uncharacterized protein n=1 Tax=Cuscuta epithymum TaxID=186058 RepID=A0AAV0EZN9_9ASTE|nr:unnamed protein product [Cuscuta epithymum]
MVVSSGGRGFRGGGGGHYSSSRSKSDSFVRYAAAGKGFSFGSDFSSKLSSNELESKVFHCEGLIEFYERCKFLHRRGLRNRSCEYPLERLEKDCAEFKSFWGEWWSRELKKDFCERTVSEYQMMVNGLPRDHPAEKLNELVRTTSMIEKYRVLLKEMCGIGIEAAD